MATREPGRGWYVFGYLMLVIAVLIGRFLLRSAAEAPDTLFFTVIYAALLTWVVSIGIFIVSRLRARGWWR